MPDGIMFDLDNTLAQSKEPVDETMAHLLIVLLSQIPVAIISGGKLTQLIRQVVNRISTRAVMERLFLFPTSGAALYRYKKGSEWKCVYEIRLTDAESDDITRAIHTATATVGIVDMSKAAYGNRIEQRGTQVSFSALGQEAPFQKKIAWDPDRKKRTALQQTLITLLPNYEIRIGGSTTIDITKKGIDKAYGVRQFATTLSLAPSQLLYVGDELAHGGNDEVVLATNITTHVVSNPENTKVFIRSLLFADSTKRSSA